MNISKSALPARYGSASEDDRGHPRFGEYQQYRYAMALLLVDSADFPDWLRARQAEEAITAEATHPRFAEWQRQFIAGRKGREKTLPNGKPNAFPHNFRLWLASA